MITTQNIEATKAFKELDKVTKQIYQKKAMMDKVKQEFQIAKNVGLERFKEFHPTRPYIEKAIIELLELEN
ncbi:hypothetical protein [Flavobacterium facile]|uniref:hypothetical protein n=1 Tax=Flavobacterium facile TaxID=2893174 RepID=UPI002E771EAD|nr:hypothetical protein [Flavobacterium sp. T-12]